MRSAEAIGSAFGLDVVTVRDGGDVLIVSRGCGLMMAVADASPLVRLAIDMDSASNPWNVLPLIDWAIAAGIARRVALVGWHSISPREQTLAIADRFASVTTAYLPDIVETLPCRRVATLAALIDELSRQQ